jgi:hypothetical protein
MPVKQSHTHNKITPYLIHTRIPFPQLRSDWARLILWCNPKEWSCQKLVTITINTPPDTQHRVKLPYEFQNVFILLVIAAGESSQQCDNSPDVQPGELRLDSRPGPGGLYHLMNGYRGDTSTGINRPDHQISKLGTSGATPPLYRCLYGVHSSNSDTTTRRLVTTTFIRNATVLRSMFIYLRPKLIRTQATVERAIASPVCTRHHVPDVICPNIRTMNIQIQVQTHTRGLRITSRSRFENNFF